MNMDKFQALYDRSKAVQEDNLVILDTQQDLCEKAVLLAKLKHARTLARRNGLDDATLDLWKGAYDIFNVLGIKEDAFREAEESQQIEIFDLGVAKYEKSIRSEIKNKLSTVLAASLTDITNRRPIPAVGSTNDRTRLVYNQYACETFMDTFHQILQKISLAANMDYTYKQFKAYVKKEMPDLLHMVNTKISTEGYTTMRLPHPQVQTLTEGEWPSVESINTASKKMDAITYPELLNRLNLYIQHVGKRIDNAESLVNEIKYHCLVAQMLMSTKNAMMTMRESHRMLAADMSQEGFFKELGTSFKLVGFEHSYFIDIFRKMINHIQHLGPDEEEQLLNMDMGFKFMLAKPILRMGSLLMQFTGQVAGATVWTRDSEKISEYAERALTDLNIKYHTQTVEVNSILESRESRARSSLRGNGYTKASLITTYQNGIRLLTAIDRHKLDALGTFYGTIDIAYSVGEGVHMIKQDLFRIARNILDV